MHPAELVLNYLCKYDALYHVQLPCVCKLKTCSFRSLIFIRALLNYTFLLDGTIKKGLGSLGLGEEDCDTSTDMTENSNHLPSSLAKADFYL